MIAVAASRRKNGRQSSSSSPAATRTKASLERGSGSPSSRSSLRSMEAASGSRITPAAAPRSGCGCPCTRWRGLPGRRPWPASAAAPARPSGSVSASAAAASRADRPPTPPAPRPPRRAPPPLRPRAPGGRPGGRAALRRRPGATRGRHARRLRAGPPPTRSRAPAPPTGSRPVPAPGLPFRNGARPVGYQTSRLAGSTSVTLLADVVAASQEVAETSARSRKVALLADLLGRLDPGEVAIAAGLLSGVPRQGRVGVGYSTIYGIESSPAEESTLTVADVDTAISAIQAATGSGSGARRKELLAGLLDRATEPEAGFVRRLFTGELRQGALAGVMVDAVAKAAGVPAALARRALMLSGDLTRTADIAMSAGEEGLREVGFELFRPILPMLASTAESVADAVSSFERASVEWKLDGIRIQIHRRGDEVRIYTRNLNEITHALPGIVEAVRRLDVKQAVLDGEAIWMADDEPAAFQETVAQIDADAPPEGISTFLFDLLHLDGQDLLDTPLEERAAKLDAIASSLRVPSILTSEPGDGERALEQSLAAGHEGVVVKDAASLYAAGRRGKAWRKVKPVRTYDLVVLGAEWGHGRRQGWLSNLHLGAREPRTGEFVMVGKTFKGMTDELLEWQTKELQQRETERRGITVFVRPELVVEIALDGVQSSTRYPGGVALRFARVKRYRPDKRADEADTIDELRSLLRTQASR